jgi:hypothetical protein
MPSNFEHKQITKKRRATKATSSSFAKRFAVVVAGRWAQAKKIRIVKSSQNNRFF